MTRSDHSRRPRHVALLLIGLLLAVAMAACGGDDDSSPQTEADPNATTFDYDYTIPEGAGLAIDAGEPLDILPAELDAKVGQVIRIVNNDDRGHVVGPFFVGANETLTQKFRSAGEFSGECSVHPSGRIVLKVTA